MKRKVVFGLVVFLIMISVVANCFATSVDPNSFNVDSDELRLISEMIKDVKNASVYELKQEVTLSGETVYGNVYLFGRDVTVKDETIVGDLFICAENVELSEDVVVDGNVFVAASKAKINSTINRELYVACSDLNLGETSVVEYGVSVAAEHIILAGECQRNFNASVSNFEINDTAIISGDLNYSSEKEATISEEATITNINFSKYVEEEKSTLDIVKEYVFDFARYFILTMIVLIVVIKLLPRFLEKMNDFVSIGSLGAGILALILVPIVLVLMMLLSVTLTAAFALLALFILVLIISMAITNIAVARLLATKKENIKLPIWTAIVTAVTWGIYQIPVVGVIAAFIWVMIGLGIATRYVFSKKQSE